MSSADIRVKQSTDPADPEVATNRVGGKDYQVVKLASGDADAATLVTATSGLPVEIVGDVPLPAGAATDASLATAIAALSAILDELQGTLDVSAGSLPLPTGAATQTTLAAVLAALGQTLAVSGPLTDAQLRATAVAISAVVLPLPTGAATEATLAAIQSALAGTIDVAGPLTDAELRASPVSVTADSLPLPTGAATQTTLASVLEALQGILSVSVTGAVEIANDAGNPLPVTASALPLPTGAATQSTLAAILSALASVAVTGPLTDAQLRATPVEVSATALPLPTGAATQTTLAAILAALASVAVTGPLTDTQLRASAVPVSIAGNQSVNLQTANGSTIALGNGAATAGTLRVAVATDSLVRNVDNSAFTDGATPVATAGFILDEVAGTALSENDVGAARMDSKRAQVATLEDATTRGQRLAINSSGAASVVSTANASTTAATPTQGLKTVAAVGAPERLVGSATLVESVQIQACKGFNSSNATAVFIGNASGNDANYLRLRPWDVIEISAPTGKKIDLNQIFIDVTTNGDGVSYLAIN